MTGKAHAWDGDEVSDRGTGMPSSSTPGETFPVHARAYRQVLGWGVMTHMLGKQKNAEAAPRHSCPVRVGELHIRRLLRARRDGQPDNPGGEASLPRAPTASCCKDPMSLGTFRPLPTWLRRVANHHPDEQFHRKTHRM